MQRFAKTLVILIFLLRKVYLLVCFSQLTRKIGPDSLANINIQKKCLNNILNANAGLEVDDMDTIWNAECDC